MRLDKLWDFMQVELEADRFQKKMMHSEKRQKLMKCRDILVEQQKNMENLENEVGGMADRLAALRDDVERLGKNLETLLEEMENHPVTTPEEAAAQQEPIAKLVKTLTDHERELTEMQQKFVNHEKAQKEIRSKAVKAKKEYDNLKGEYDVELASSKKVLEEKRAEAEAASQGIDPKLLEDYRRIKQQCDTPIAKLVGDQCGGCFMSLPAATLRRIDADEGLVLCDNCGRILYRPEKQGN